MRTVEDYWLELNRISSGKFELNIQTPRVDGTCLNIYIKLTLKELLTILTDIEDVVIRDGK